VKLEMVICLLERGVEDWMAYNGAKILLRFFFYHRFKIATICIHPSTVSFIHGSTHRVAKTRHVSSIIIERIGRVVKTVWGMTGTFGGSSPLEFGFYFSLQLFMMLYLEYLCLDRSGDYAHQGMYVSQQHILSVRSFATFGYINLKHACRIRSILVMYLSSPFLSTQFAC